MDKSIKVRMDTLLAATIGMAIQDGVSFRRDKETSSRTQCVECKAEIPPGRAGRKCSSCREKKESGSCE